MTEKSQVRQYEGIYTTPKRSFWLLRISVLLSGLFVLLTWLFTLLSIYSVWFFTQSAHRPLYWLSSLFSSGILAFSRKFLYNVPGVPKVTLKTRLISRLLIIISILQRKILSGTRRFVDFTVCISSFRVDCNLRLSFMRVVNFLNHKRALLFGKRYFWYRGAKKVPFFRRDEKAKVEENFLYRRREGTLITALYLIFSLTIFGKLWAWSGVGGARRCRGNIFCSRSRRGNRPIRLTAITEANKSNFKSFVSFVWGFLRLPQSYC